VNRCKSKHCWVDGRLVEKGLPHYRVDPDPPVVSSEPVSTVETQNNDGGSSSLLENGWGDSTWESYEDYNFESSLFGDGFGRGLWN
jgi:hypothetical protein